MLLAGLATATAVTGVGLSAAPAGQADELSAPYFTVETFGFSRQQADKLAKSLDVRVNRLASGQIVIDSDLGVLSPPVTQIRTVAAEPRSDGSDSEVKEVVESTVDIATLKQMKFANAKSLITRAERALPSLPEVKRTWVAARNEAEQARPDGTSLGAYQLSTTVTARMTLAGRPLIGPGSYQKLVFGPNGQVAIGTINNMELRPAGKVGIISPQDALTRCREISKTVSANAVPQLVFYAPGWTSQVTTVLPHYVCPQAGLGDGDTPPTTPSGVIIPAAPSQTPTISLSAQRDGSDLTGQASVRGGQKPYIVTWITAGAEITTESDEAVSARVTEIDSKLATDSPGPVVSVTVEDSNGMVAQAELTLPSNGRRTSNSGYGPTAIDLATVEQHSYWTAFPRMPAVQQEASGLRKALRDRGYPHSFYWTHPRWTVEAMFNSSGTTEFNDSRYADAADITHFVGHGLFGRLFFEPTDLVHPDLAQPWIDTTSMALGDTDLEFLNLMACQTMNGTPGTAANTWYPVFQGLHIINGFKTNASATEGGPVMSRRFGNKVYQRGVNIVQAWAYAGIMSQPSTRVVRSLAPVRARDGVTTINDGYFRNYGPDIPNNQIGTFWIVTTNT